MAPFRRSKGGAARAEASPFRVQAEIPSPDDADVAAALEETARDLERRWPVAPLPVERAASPKMALLNGVFVVTGLLMGTSASSPSDRLVGWVNVLFFGAGLLISLGVLEPSTPGALDAWLVRPKLRALLGVALTLGAVDGALWLLALGESGFGWPLRLVVGLCAATLLAATALRLRDALVKTAAARARFVVTSRGLLERRRTFAVLYPLPRGWGAGARQGALGLSFGKNSAPFALRLHGPAPARRVRREVERHARRLAHTRRRTGFDVVVDAQGLHRTEEALSGHRTRLSSTGLDPHAT